MVVVLYRYPESKMTNQYKRVKAWKRTNIGKVDITSHG